jgi:CubicO group peptidase (beta-lactamase class C family)
MRLLGILFAASLLANDAYPPARFTDPQRVQKLRAALPAVDKLFQQYAAEEKIPGMVWGVVIDGELAHVGATGLQSRATKAPANANTVYRIASMTKSFTALAILKLRDEGKLSLEDPIAKWIPEFARMEMPTRDTAPIRIRQLMSHSSGLPEDNPWGDQQLGIDDTTLDRWLRTGLPFSTAPDTRYEYSNYAFGLLGRIITKAARQPYEKYVTEQILAKLGMTSSTFEFSRVPAATRATGYRLKPDGTYEEEQPLPHGVFGAMGGLLTNAGDLGKYVALHLNAWPPRDDNDNGPVRRSSIREMSHLWTPSNLIASRGKASQSGYGYGLRVTADCRFAHIVGHGGGLPGFGSYMAWLPEHGVGIFAMATLTYSGPSKPIQAAFDVLNQTGGLQKREAPPSKPLTEMGAHLANLWNNWNDAEAKQIAAMNLFLDAPIPQRRAQIDALKKEVGQCAAAGPVIPENWLRGQFNMRCANGVVGVFYTLAPTQPPLVQHVEFRRLESEKVRMGAPTGAPAGVACAE